MKILNELSHPSMVRLLEIVTSVGEVSLVRLRIIPCLVAQHHSSNATFQKYDSRNGVRACQCLVLWCSYDRNIKGFVVPLMQLL